MYYYYISETNGVQVGKFFKRIKREKKFSDI